MNTDMNMEKAMSIDMNMERAMSIGMSMERVMSADMSMGVSTERVMSTVMGMDTEDVRQVRVMIYTAGCVHADIICTTAPARDLDRAGFLRYCQRGRA